MEEEAEQRAGSDFEGYNVAEDCTLEQALDEYKAADERVWTLTSKYLYPPEEVPYVGQRQLVFPNVAARDEYEEVRRLAREAEERYEAVADERRKREQADNK